jgi:hypothetical protein
MTSSLQSVLMRDTSRIRQNENRETERIHWDLHDDPVALDPSFDIGSPRKVARLLYEVREVCLGALVVRTSARADQAQRSERGGRWRTEYRVEVSTLGELCYSRSPSESRR